MGLVDRPIDDLDESVLLTLVGSDERERRRLEFKRDLPGPGSDARKEFLHDVTSFANTAGGYLIFGIAEVQGVATAVKGVDMSGADDTVLRLENMMRDGVEPRLPGVTLRWVELASGRGVLALEIPRSWARPHMVRASARFYARNSAGKYPLDRDEIRAAFALEDSIPRRARAWHRDRSLAVQAGETIHPLRPHGSAVLTIAPYASFGVGGPVLDLTGTDDPRGVLSPIYGAQVTRWNLDGWLAYHGDVNGLNSSLQVHRTGQIEHVMGHIAERDPRTVQVVGAPDIHVAGKFLADKLMVVTRDALRYLRTHSHAPPVIVQLTVMGVEGAVLDLGRELYGPFDRDVLALGEVTFEEHPADDSPDAIGDLLDRLANAAGRERWPN